MRSSLFGLVLLMLPMLAPPALADSIATHEKACAANVVESCLRGTQLAQAARDDALMVRFAERGCQLGNVISCSDMGMFNLLGIGMPVNTAKALPLIRTGCRKGYSRACANLGWMYYTGRGVRKSVSKAAKFYKTGCDGKSGAACANLAQMYIQGDGVRVDRARAEQLLRRACDLGHNRAC